MNNPSMDQNRNDQRISSLIDMGKVVEVNLSNYTARVQVKPTLITGWLRMGMMRALGDQMTWPYEVGEEVVFYTQSGDMRKGAILCALPNGINAANASAKVLRANASGGFDLTGNVSIKGDVDVEGKITSTDDQVAGGISQISQVTVVARRENHHEIHWRKFGHRREP